MRYLELDALRGIASLAVVFYHMAMYFKLDVKGYSMFDGLFLHGNLGVQLFFMISGFVIYRSVQWHSSVKIFLISRFSRLFPAYWISVVLTFVVIKITPYWSPDVSFTEMLINLTMLQHWFKVRNVDGVYWSLAVELSFYMLITLLILFKSQKRIELLGMIWLALMLAAYYGNAQWVYKMNYNIPLLRFGTLFFAGIIFYLIETQGYTPLRCIGLMACYVTHFSISPLVESCIVAVFFLVFLLFIHRKLNFLCSKTLVFFGNISFVLYLVNQEIGYQLLNATELLGLAAPFLKIVFSLSFIVALSAGITFYIEKPVMNWIRSFFIDEYKK